MNGLISVRLSVRMEELGCHWQDCHKIGHLKIKKKSVKKSKVSLKYDKNNGYFSNDVCTL